VIPAILAAPLVQGVVGSVIGGVMSAFTPSAPEPSTSATFDSQFNRAAAPAASTAVTPGMAGTLRSTEWSQMSDTDAKTWLTSLSGRHVDATDASGRTVSGVVNGVQLNGGVLSLNIGGQLVNLSQLKQISWSSTAI